MPSHTTDLTRKACDVARILELTLQGMPAPSITRETRFHYVQAIQDAHGWPDMDTVRAMHRELVLLGELPVTFDVSPSLVALGAPS